MCKEIQWAPNPGGDRHGQKIKADDQVVSGPSAPWENYGLG